MQTNEERQAEIQQDDYSGSRYEHAQENAAINDILDSLRT
jgi:hypothetical protein